jgi:hypothetical protein
MNWLDRLVVIVVIVVAFAIGHVAAQSPSDSYSRDREVRALESIASSLKRLEKCGR